MKRANDSSKFLVNPRLDGVNKSMTTGEIQTQLIGGPGFEVFLGKVIPYYDFDLECESEADMKAQHFAKAKLAFETIQSMYPKGKVMTFDSSGLKLKDGKSAWRLSFHLRVRGAGCFAQGSDILSTLPATFDDAPYKVEGKQQKFRIPYCSKTEEDKRVLKRIIFENDKIVTLDRLEYCDVLNESLDHYLIQNVEHEYLRASAAVKEVKEVKEANKITIEVKSAAHDEKKDFKAEDILEMRTELLVSYEYVEQLCSCLTPERMKDYKKWRDVMYCLKNISDDSGLDLLKLALKTSALAGALYNEAASIRYYNDAKQDQIERLRLAALIRWAQNDDPMKFASFDKPVDIKEQWIHKSDEGLAEQFKLLHDDIKVVNPETGAGYVWSSNALIWEPKSGAEIANLISPSLRLYIEPLKKGKKEDGVKVIEKLLKYVCGTCGTRNIFSKVKIIMLSTTFEESLNSVSHEVPIKDGMVVDLKTLVSRKRVKTDLYSFVCPVALTDETKHAERFMMEVFPDKEVRDYMNKLMGLAMTGETLREFYILYGESASNGKTTLMGLLQKICGKWASPLSKEVFIKSPMARSAGSHTSYLMPLVGIRAGISSEIDEDEKFDTAQLKKLSGNDIITARGCYEKKEIAFKCIAKLFLCTNHIPHFNAQDAGILDRLVFILFGSRFVDQPVAGELKRDKEFIDDLQTKWLDEVFTLWARGANLFYKEGLKRPDAIQKATKDAADSVDFVAQFIDDCLEVDAESKMCITELFGHFTGWAFTSKVDGASKIGKKGFSQSLKQRKMNLIRSNGTKLKGYKLKEKPMDEKKEDAVAALQKYV